MAAKKSPTLSDMNSPIDTVEAAVEAAGKATNKKKNKGGRPKKNPHAQDVKLTALVPSELHQDLKDLSNLTGKPLVQIVVEALLDYTGQHKAILAEQKKLREKM